MLPEDAWSRERLLGCLAEIATSIDVVDEPPPPPDTGGTRHRTADVVAARLPARRLARCRACRPLLALLRVPAHPSRHRIASTAGLLHEFDKPLDAQSLRTTLEQLITGVDGLSPGHIYANTMRALLNLASQVDGPLRLIGGQPAQCDLPAFVQHLHTLEEVVNAIHSHLGEYLQSPHFPRAKYEIFVLQHMQLLTFLQRVQTGLAQGVGKTGAEMVAFVAQIAHAARVLLFQPLLLHALQVLHALVAVPTEEVAGSMRVAMAYPSDDATDADRVEWLQLNLLLQFQTVYKMALCQTTIYQHSYSPGEQQLLQGFLRLEEIYTHLIGRFPQCCPLSDQEQAVLADGKFFEVAQELELARVSASPPSRRMSPERGAGLRLRHPWCPVSVESPWLLPPRPGG